MSGLLEERRLSLTELAQREGVNATTIWRWTLRGVRGGIRLESFIVGGRRYTTEQAFTRFVERITAAADPEPQSLRTSPEHSRASNDAANRLTSEGF